MSKSNLTGTCHQFQQPNKAQNGKKCHEISKKYDNNEKKEKRISKIIIVPIYNYQN